MEFIITGFFIIFFSYILLYSLYDFLFKRSTIEGLSSLQIAQNSQSKASEGNKKIVTQNTTSPNATYSGATGLVQTPSNP